MACSQQQAVVRKHAVHWCLCMLLAMRGSAWSSVELNARPLNFSRTKFAFIYFQPIQNRQGQRRLEANRRCFKADGCRMLIDESLSPPWRGTQSPFFSPRLVRAA